MGSIGGTATKERFEPVRSLIFGTARITDKFTDIDGYSNKKTERGMLADLAKAVDNYDKGEADYIRTMITDKEIAQAPPTGEPAYILEWEDVPSASRYIDEDGKDATISRKEGVEIEHKDARYYVHIRFYHS